MKSIIEELYRNSEHFDEKFARTTEYTRIEEEIFVEMGFWAKKLTSGEFARLEDLRGKLCRANDIENEQHFAFGFKLAAMVMSEVFFTREALLK